MLWRKKRRMERGKEEKKDGEMRRREVRWRDEKERSKMKR